MKTKITFILALLMATISLAQQGINYKAVIKDGTGNILANDLIQVEFTILDGASSVYSETQSPTTDANGIIIINIGEGTPITGVFEDIDWSSMNHFLNVKVNTGGGLQDLGTTGFNTVPYANIAKEVENPTWDRGVTGDISFNDGDVGIGTTSPQNPLSVLQTTGSTNTVRFQSLDHPSNKDLLELKIGGGSPADSQFIEMENGNVIVAQINGDGSAYLNSIKFHDLTTQTTAAVGPIAYGFVKSDAVITSGSGNFTAFWNPTLNRYEIDIVGITYSFTLFTTNVTSSFSSIHRLRVSSNNAGKLLVYLYNSVGTAVQGSFQFTTYQ